jgi:cytoskeleton protein RodZ
MLIGAAVLAVLAALLGAWQFLSARPSTTTVRPVQNNAVTSDAIALQPPQIRIEPTPGMAGDAAAIPAQIPVPPGGRQLVFVFEEKSWLEVKDATQRIVATGVFPAGERQTAVGKPPFQIWIGKASGVKVYDGEREIDLKPHTRDEVARLTVE